MKSNKVLTIHLQDEWLAYETRELVRLFLDWHLCELIIDPEAAFPFPAKPPGLVCRRSPFADGTVWQLSLNLSGEPLTVEIPQPVGWQSLSMARREAKSRYKAALYELLQEAAPTFLPWGILTGVRPVKLAHQLFVTLKDWNRVSFELQSKYRVSTDRARLMTGIARTQQPLLKAADASTVSLYIGIPLCPSRCSYCSFISQSVSGPVDPLVEDYLQALLQELRGALDWLHHRRWRIDTIYIGGGTPSILTADQSARLMETLASGCNLRQVREITFEAGRPDTITREKLAVLHQYPVRRISINPQTLHQKTLQRINRCHTVKEFYRAWQLAADAGFETMNLDLIIGLPGEGAEEVDRTLKAIAPLAPTNLTVHALALKRSSLLKTDAIGHSLSDEEARRIMDQVYRFASTQNLHPYYLYRQKEIAGHLENAGFSRTGQEGLYNILMMEEKQTILGIGAGAVSKWVYPDTDRIERFPQVKNLQLYMHRIKEKGFDHPSWNAAFPDQPPIERQ